MENSVTGIVIGSVGGVLAAIAVMWCVVITVICLIKNQCCCCCWDDKEDELGECNASHTEDTCHYPYIYFNPLPTFFNLHSISLFFYLPNFIKINSKQTFCNIVF